VKALREDLARLLGESANTEARAKDQLSAVNRKIEGVLRAIENGAWNDSLKQRLNDLEAQQRQLQDHLSLAAKPGPVSACIRMRRPRMRRSLRICRHRSINPRSAPRRWKACAP
jgi:hypothetical protein